MDAFSPMPAAPVSSQRDIFLRGVEDGAPIRLTDTAEDEMAPVWSPDGRRIAFVRRIPRAPCEILLVPVPQGEPRLVGRCSVESMTRLAWTRDGEILLSDRPTRDAVRRIRALSPDTGRMREVTSPPVTSPGDLDPVVTHRGDRMVFRRATTYGVADLYAAEVSGAGLRPLTRDGWKAVGYAFTADVGRLHPAVDACSPGYGPAGVRPSVRRQDRVDGGRGR